MLTDLKTPIATNVNTISGFNNIIANYPDLANKLTITFNPTQTPVYFRYNGHDIGSTTITQDGDDNINQPLDLFIDTDNKIFMICIVASGDMPSIICCYSDDDDYLIQTVTNKLFAIVGNNEAEIMNISTYGQPTLTPNTFSGLYFYTENKIFDKIIRLSSTPTYLQHTVIKTPTKEILNFTPNVNYLTQVNNCIGVAIDI